MMLSSPPLSARLANSPKINSLLSSSNLNHSTSSATPRKPRQQASMTIGTSRTSRRFATAAVASVDLVSSEDDEVEIVARPSQKDAGENKRKAERSGTGSDSKRTLRPVSTFAPAPADFLVDGISSQTRSGVDASKGAGILPPPPAQVESSGKRISRHSESRTQSSSTQSSSQSINILHPPSSARHASTSSSKRLTRPVKVSNDHSMTTAWQPFASTSKIPAAHPSRAASSSKPLLLSSDPATPKAAANYQQQLASRHRPESPLTPRRDKKRPSLSPPATIRKRPTSSVVIEKDVVLPALAQYSSAIGPAHAKPYSINWSRCDPFILPSLLLRSEYLEHGQLTYAQSRPLPAVGFRVGVKKPFAFPAAPVRPTATARVRWEGSIEMGNLMDRLDRSDFVAVCWARDVTFPTVPHQVLPLAHGRSAVSAIPRETRVRGVNIAGVDLLLLGLEFPLKRAIIMGTVVEVVQSFKEGAAPEIAYTIDDGTQLIECCCTLAPTPAPINQDLKCAIAELPLAHRPRPPDKVDIMQVGTLVRVLGDIVAGRYATAGKRLAVVKIESIKDCNAETEHHLTVARLHREVYSQPFDVRAIIHGMMKQERKDEKAWRGSQAPSSDIGSPHKAKKPPKFPHPSTLGESLTLDVFTAYIIDHLTRHYNKAHPPVSDSDYESDADSGGDTPPPLPPLKFDLLQLENTKSLRVFAQLLAQKLAQDKINKSSVKLAPSGLVEKKRWVAGSGYSRGAAKILPPPSSIYSASSIQVTGNESMDTSTASVSGTQLRGLRSVVAVGPLQGDELLKATSRQFLNAVRRMCKDGRIVSAPEEPEEVEEEMQLPEVLKNAFGRFYDGEGLPDAPVYPGGAAPESPLSKQYRLEQERKHRFGSVSGENKTVIRDDEEDAKYARRLQRKQKNDDRERDSDYEYDTEEEERLIAKGHLIKKKTVVPKVESVTPQKIKRSTSPSRSVLSSSGKTPQALGAGLLSRSNRSSSFSSSHSVGGESSTDLMTGVDSEVFHVVTRDLLGPVILGIVKEEAQRNAQQWRPRLTRDHNHEEATKVVDTRGITEDSIRAVLSRNPRWRAVFATSPVVKDAITMLLNRGNLEWYGLKKYELPRR